MIKRTAGIHTSVHKTHDLVGNYIYREPPKPGKYTPLTTKIEEDRDDIDFIFEGFSKYREKYFVLLLSDETFVISLTYVSRGRIITFDEKYIICGDRRKIPLVVVYCTDVPTNPKEMLKYLPYRVERECYSTIKNYPQPLEVEYYKKADLPPYYFRDEDLYINMATMRIEDVQERLYKCTTYPRTKTYKDVINYDDWARLIGELVPPDEEVNEVLEKAKAKLSSKQFVCFTQRNFMPTYELGRGRQKIVDAFTKTGKAYLESKNITKPTFGKFIELMYNIEWPSIKLIDGDIITKATRMQFNYVLSYVQYRGDLADGRYSLDCGNFAIYNGIVYNMGFDCNINPIPIRRNFTKYTHFRYALPEGTIFEKTENGHKTNDGFHIYADPEDDISTLIGNVRWWIWENKHPTTYFNNTECAIKFTY